MKALFFRGLVGALAMVCAMVALESGAHAAGCILNVTCELASGTPPVLVPPLGAPYSALASGLFEMSNTDLYIPGLMPIAITRTYRSEDRNTSNNFNSRSFGIGQMLNYDIFLYSKSEISNGNYIDAELVMPDGAELKCQNTGNTVNYWLATFVCAQQPSDIWFGSTLAWNASTLQWNLTRKDKTVYAFTPGQPLRSITDGYGNRITITRNTNLAPTCSRAGTLISSNDGRWVRLCYDGSDPTTISEAFDSSGREVDYNYGTGTPKFLTKVIYPSFGGIFVSYQNGNICLDLQFITLSSGEQISVGVTKASGACRLDDVIFGGGPSVNQVTYQYTISSQYNNSSGDISQVDATMMIPVPNGAPSGGTTQRQLSFDGNGYLTGDTRGYGSSLARTTSYSRDVNTELPCTTTDPLGRVTSYLYDQQSTCAGSNITLANVTNITQSNLVSPSQAVTWAFTYDPTFSEVASITDPLQHTTTITIDPVTGNATALMDPMGRTWTATYQPSGQIKSIADQLNNTTQFGYSGSLDLSSITDPLGNVTNFKPDLLGRLQSVTTPLRETTSFTYDGFSHVATVTDPNNNLTQYTWDFDGHLTKLIDAKQNTTRWTWMVPNPNWDVTECDALGHCLEWDIDAASGLPESYQDKRGIRTVYTYDALERVSKASFNTLGKAGFPQTSITYTYDAADRVLNLTDTGGGNPTSSGNTRSFTYDGLDNVLTAVDNSPENLTAVINTYDLASRRISMTPSGQTTINYAYNNANDLMVVCQGAIINNHCQTPLGATLAYDLADRRSNMQLPNGVAVTVPFVNGHDQPNGYDANSRVLELDYAANGMNLGNLTYSYDNDGRITGVGGSLASINLPAAVSGNVYSAANQVTSWNGHPANNDTAKNLTLDPTNSAAYAWDERNQLSSVNTPSDYWYFYDALGRRETADNFGSITGYLYDDVNVVEATGNSAATYLTMPSSGEVFAITQGSTTSVPLHDVLGSAIGLVNSGGSLATQYTYEPFGRPTTTGAASSFPYLFAGMEYDATTGLYHTPARYYSPGLQRFLSEDPLGHAAGDPNLFAYAGNDPVNFSDPSGLQEVAGADVVGAGEAGGDFADVGVAQSLGLGLGFASQLSNLKLSSHMSRITSQGRSTGGRLGTNSLGVSSGQIVLAQAEIEDDTGQGGWLQNTVVHPSFPNIPEDDSPTAPENLGEGWETRPDGNYANPKLGQGLHPDNHEPKEFHFDWHFREPYKKKFSIKKQNGEIFFWDKALQKWLDEIPADLPEFLPELVE